MEIEIAFAIKRTHAFFEPDRRVRRIDSLHNLASTAIEFEHKIRRYSSVKKSRHLRFTQANLDHMLINERDNASTLYSTPRCQTNIDGNRIVSYALNLAHLAFSYQ